MQRFLAQLGTIGYVSSALIGKAYALPQNELDQIQDVSEQTSITGVILDLIQLVLDFVLILAVLFVIVAGLRLIISAGDEGQKESAKKTIIYVIVGIVVILFARAIVVYVNDYFVNGTN